MSNSQQRTDTYVRKLEVGQLFTPAAPINNKELLAGRVTQIDRIIQTISQAGQHAVLFGERGVGKTSLANCLAGFLEGAKTAILPVRVQCDSSDDFASLWRRAFSAIKVSTKVISIGLRPEETEQISSLADAIQDPITPDLVRISLTALAAHCLPIVIIDEFDRFADFGATRLFADTVKVLSDYAVRATLVFVGVADSVDSLIDGHESIMRNLVQVLLPRMSVAEMVALVNGRLPKAEMTITSDALDRICLLSGGLPHYTHLIAQHAAWAAIDSSVNEIADVHVGAAMSSAIANAQQTIERAYHRATMSPRKDSLFPEVLLACALASCDELGYFAPSDVRAPMSAIMGKDCTISSFVRHLGDFCKESRGTVLQEIGAKYQRRFRFRNPLLQPYVVMKGIAGSLVTLDQVGRFRDSRP
jgi:energy-coupling factor transporter ATP-binding protein EcfA2